MPLERKALLGALVVPLTLLALLTLNWATTTLSGIEEPLYRRDLLAFGTAIAAALVVQALVIALIHVVAKSQRLTTALAAVLCVANLWSMHLILSETYMDLPKAGKAALLIGIALVIFMLLHQSLLSKAWFGGIALAVAAIIGVNVASYVFKARSEASTGASGGYDNTTVSTASDKVRKVKFQTTPNVYLIGFESAGPAAVLQKYLGLADAPLPRAAQERGFRVFRNAFAEGGATRPSWHALLAMDADYAESTSTRFGRAHMFSGAIPSPLFEIFKYNGYEITALYQNSYLGTTKGPYVDSYTIAKPFSPCDGGFLHKKIARYLFWGACSLRSALFADAAAATDPIEQLRATVANVAAKGTPQLVIAHTSPPQHTPTNGTWGGSADEIRAFRDVYRKASDTAVKNLDRILAAIKEHDSSAVLLIFGDHGPTLSRTKTFEDDATYFVQDRYGILAGVYPQETCKDTFDSPFSAGYVTTPELARLLVKCLAGGVDPFTVPYTHEVRTKRYTIDFRKYLYE
jgi:hypothetical protein